MSDIPILLKEWFTSPLAGEVDARFSARRVRGVFQKIDGILLLDKPLHLTSNHALQRVKRLFNAKKAGHTGSLDPLATGMLPLCFGEATKVSQFLLDSDKHYYVEAKLGIKTTTGDAEGDVIAKSVVDVNLERIHAVLQEFIGDIKQIPPMFSALKYQGKPLYELARQGLEVERKVRDVTIFSIEFIRFDNDLLIFNVHCSKGTYIRTLVEDIGEKLKCGAHVSALRRVSVSSYQKNKMYTLEELDELHSQNKLLDCLLPIDTAIQHFPRVTLSEVATYHIRLGQYVIVPDEVSGFVRLFSENEEFIGIGEMTGDGRVAPKRLVVL